MCVVALGFFEGVFVVFFFPMGSLIFLLACRGDRLCFPCCCAVVADSAVWDPHDLTFVLEGGCTPI